MFGFDLCSTFFASIFFLLLFLALLFGWFIFNLFEAFEYNFLNLWKIILLF